LAPSCSGVGGRRKRRRKKKRKRERERERGKGGFREFRKELTSRGWLVYVECTKAPLAPGFAERAL
jgi:hypothetical protein